MPQIDPYWDYTALIMHCDEMVDPYFNNLVSAMSGTTLIDEIGAKTIGSSAIISSAAGGVKGFYIGAAPSYSVEVATPSTIYQSDYCVEFWHWNSMGSSSGTQSIVAETASTSQFQLTFTPTSNTWSINSRGASSSVVYALTRSVWQHFVITSVSGTTYFYINGTLIKSFVTGNGTTDASKLKLVGESITINGYYTDIRVYNCAKYTGDRFTVPDLPGPPYTSLATSSRLKKSIKCGGSAMVPHNIDPAIGDACLRLDGSGWASITNDTGDFAFGSGDFTIEVWIKATLEWNAQPSNATVLGGTVASWRIQKDPSYPDKISFTAGSISYPSLTTPKSNTWQHWVFTRESGRLMIFCDGMLENTYLCTTSITSSTFYIGYSASPVVYFRGNVDELRITQQYCRYPYSQLDFGPAPINASDSDSLWNKVSLAMKFNGVDESTDLIDVKGKVITNYGVVLRRSQSISLNETSAHFDGVLAKIEASASADFTMQTGDFTVEFWIYCPLGSDYPLISLGGAAGIYLELSASGSVEVKSNGTTTLTSSTYVAANTWTQIVIDRRDQVTRLYILGRYQGGWVDINNYTGNTLWIGYDVSQVNTSTYLGYMDDLRITKGASRYHKLSTFTPSTEPYVEGFQSIRGIVKDHNSVPCSRRINIHARNGGRLIGSTMSDPVTGVFEMPAMEKCYAVAFDNTGNYNTVIIDNIDPIR